MTPPADWIRAQDHDFVVSFDNPAMGVTVIRGFDTLEEAQAHAAHYERKYGQFEDYAPATISPAPGEEQRDA
jgi:hypothetical protein